MFCFVCLLLSLAVCVVVLFRLFWLVVLRNRLATGISFGSSWSLVLVDVVSERERERERERGERREREKEGEREETREREREKREKKDERQRTEGRSGRRE